MDKLYRLECDGIYYYYLYYERRKVIINFVKTYNPKGNIKTDIVDVKEVIANDPCLTDHDDEDIFYKNQVYIGVTTEDDGKVWSIYKNRLYSYNVDLTQLFSSFHLIRYDYYGKLPTNLLREFLLADSVLYNTYELFNVVDKLSERAINTPTYIKSLTIFLLMMNYDVDIDFMKVYVNKFQARIRL